MAPNMINSNWLRPTLALCMLAGLLALGGCGGGSGAPNNPFAPGPATVGPLFVLPANAVVYAHTPATLQVSGGATPYQAFSSNSAVLPVAQNVDTGVIVLIPAEVAADLSRDSAWLARILASDIASSATARCTASLTATLATTSRCRAPPTALTLISAAFS